MTYHKLKIDKAEKQELPAYAAIDLGTNNCRLLVANIVSNDDKISLKVLDSFSRIVKLGEDLSNVGKLDEYAMERTLDALRICRRKLDNHNIVDWHFVATEACRKAKNSTDFIQRIEREAGINIEIISPEREAELAFLGCCSLVNTECDKVLAFDIGGGSTEIMWVDIKRHKQEGSLFPFTPHMKDWVSIPYGVMNLSEKLGSPGYAELYFEDLVNKITKALKPFNDKHNIAELISDNTKKHNNIQLISTSGTVTTLAAVRKGLKKYERSKIDGLNMPISEINKCTKALLKMSPSERLEHPCIGARRTDYILVGCAIFEAISKIWPFDNITIADRGVREGIIMSLAMNNKKTHTNYSS